MLIPNFERLSEGRVGGHFGSRTPVGPPFTPTGFIKMISHSFMYTLFPKLKDTLTHCINISLSHESQGVIS